MKKWLYGSIGIAFVVIIFLVLRIYLIGGQGAEDFREKGIENFEGKDISLLLTDLLEDNCRGLEAEACNTYTGCVFDVRRDSCDPAIYYNLPDAGEPCRTSSQCYGICLREEKKKRTGTCSRYLIIYGCYDLFDHEGKAANECAD